MCRWSDYRSPLPVALALAVHVLHPSFQKTLILARFRSSFVSESPSTARHPPTHCVPLRLIFFGAKFDKLPHPRRNRQTLFHIVVLAHAFCAREDPMVVHQLGCLRAARPLRPQSHWHCCGELRPCHFDETSSGCLKHVRSEQDTGKGRVS